MLLILTNEAEFYWTDKTTTPPYNPTIREFFVTTLKSHFEVDRNYKQNDE